MKKIVSIALAYMLCSNTSHAQFAPYTTIPFGSNPTGVVIADLDHDGQNDVAVATTFYFAPGLDNSLLIFHQNFGTLQSIPDIYPAPVNANYAARTIAAGDLNNDTWNDIAIGAGDSIYFWLQDSNGTFPTRHSYFSGTSGISRIAIGDANNDGIVDIVASNWGNSWITVLLGTGDSTLFQMITIPLACAGYDDLRIGKVGTDTLNSIVYMRGQMWLPSVVILKLDSAGNLLSQIDLTNNVGGSGNLTHSLVLADINHDGAINIVVTCGWNVPTAYVAAWNGTTDIFPSYSASVGDLPEAMEVTDLNCDGNPDVVIVNGGWNEYTLINDSVTIQQNSLPSFSHCPTGAMALGDINGDQKPDMVVCVFNASPTNGLAILFNNSIEYQDTAVVNTVTGYPYTFVAQTTDTVNITVSVDTIPEWILITTTTEVLITNLYDSLTEYSTSTIITGGCSGDTISVQTTLTATHDTMTTAITVYYYHVDSITTASIGEKLTDANQIKVYPNPTSGNITVEMPNRTDNMARLYNTDSKLLSEQTQSTTKYSFDLSAYPPGMYIIRTKFGDTKVIKR